MNPTTRAGIWQRALIAVVISMLAACKGNPTTPSGLQGPFAGTWQGTITDSLAGGGTATLTRLTIGVAAMPFPSRPYEITGTWHGEFPAVHSVLDFNLKGFLESSGSSDGAITLRCDVEFAGPYVFSKTIPLLAVVDGNRMTGTYMFSNCLGLGASSGTFEFVRK